MAPEFASNVAHCDHIPASLIRLRPRVKLSARSRLHLLVGEVDISDAAWWAEQQRLRFFESPMEEDAAGDRPGLEYSSGKDSDMDMGEEVGAFCRSTFRSMQTTNVQTVQAARHCCRCQ